MLIHYTVEFVQEDMSRQFVRVNCRIHVRVKIWVRICVRTISEFMSGLMSEYFIIPCGINVRIYVRRNVWTFVSIHVRVNVPMYVRISVYAYLLPESMSVLPEAMSEKCWASYRGSQAINHHILGDLIFRQAQLTKRHRGYKQLVW